MIRHNVSEILRSLRSNVGKTQDQVSEACGISKIALARYETGTRTPRIEIASRLADYYGVTVDYLLGNEGQPESVQSAPDVPSTFDSQLTQAIMAELRDAPDDMQDNILAYIRFLKSNTK